MTSALKLDPRRMACPSGYVLDLYCQWDNPAHRYNEFPHVTAHVETRAEAIRAAKAMGWKVHRNGFATCPKCVPLKKEATA